VIDITQTPPPAPVLQQALQSLGRARLLNTSGRSYRELGAQAVRAWSDDQLLAALAADGRLIRRPLLVTPAGSVLTGFKPQEWHDCLVGPG
jgi:arsenate reductase